MLFSAIICVILARLRAGRGWIFVENSVILCYHLTMDFRESLFWDVDFKKLDEEKDAEFVIGRVLDFGNLKEWKKALDLYGLSKIRATALKYIFTSRRNANFWSIMLDLPLKDLRCTRNPSLKTPEAFLTR